MSFFKKNKKKEINLTEGKTSPAKNIVSKEIKEQKEEKPKFGKMSVENSKYFAFIKKPIISEKSSSLNSLNKYSFEIPKSANKNMIRKSVERIYKVKVKQVNISNIKGKKILYRGKSGKKPNRKKAIVTLEKGYSIEILPT